MKKVIYSLPFAALLMLTACEAEEGTFPGTDKNPAVTVYTYTPEGEQYNPDNDIRIMFATNSATKEFVYLLDKAEDVDAFFEAIAPTDKETKLRDPQKEAEAEEKYVDKVLAEGKKVTVNGAENINIVETDLYGEYIISAVAIGNHYRKSLSFTGLDWNDIVQGNFMLNQTFIPSKGRLCTLQVCKQNNQLYRVKDAFGEGYSMKFELLGTTAKDDDGDSYQLFRIPLQKTPWQISLTSGGPYPIVVEDIGYWQNNAAFVTDVTGYENGMYEDGSAFFRIAWGADRGSDIGVFSFETPATFIPVQSH